LSVDNTTKQAEAGSDLDAYTTEETDDEEKDAWVVGIPI
jgi:hypothetical protein